MSEANGVLILGEIIDGNLAPITGELLGCGRKLADDLGEPLLAAFLGAGIFETVNDSLPRGADRAYVVDTPYLETYLTDIYVQVLEKMCKDLSPRILLMGQTAIGRDLAPRLAFRLVTGLSTDCIDLAIDAAKQLQPTCPVYGGNFQAIFTLASKYPHMATIRSKAFSPLKPDADRQGSVIPYTVEIDTTKIKTKYVRTVKEEAVGVKLEDANVVVAGGRGVDGPEGFKSLEELAKILEGAVGATRPPCDEKFVPSTCQVGLTGKIVAPDLYIAIGISGASQHMSGCSGARNIIAINRDPEALIFKEACFGVVGDYKQVLPAFTQKVKQLLDK
jgi:electron transfer flavoprotein alpha subunit